jgi:hypothetical protein
MSDAVDRRLETGVVSCGDDWPGVFIRGDNALMKYAPAIRGLLAGSSDPFHRAACEGLLRLLLSCETGSGAQPEPDVIQRVALAAREGGE